jgi:predicted nucleotidyltransferase
MRRDEAIGVLRRQLPELRRRFAVARLALFGSVARNEATERSDVDVLVDFDGPTSFDDYFGLKEELEAALGARVDLATRAMLKPRVKPRIEAEAVDVS